MSMNAEGTTKGQLILDMDDPYVYALIKDEFKHRLNDWDIVEPNSSTRARVYGSPDECSTDVVSELPEDDETGYPVPKDGRPCMQWTEYERVGWDSVNRGKASTIWYMYRKGLIRKAQLAHTVDQHLSKCPHRWRGEGLDEVCTHTDSEDEQQDEEEHDEEDEGDVDDNNLDHLKGTGKGVTLAELNAYKALRSDPVTEQNKPSLVDLAIKNAVNSAQGPSGREMFEENPDMFVDDEDAVESNDEDNSDYTDSNEETESESESESESEEEEEEVLPSLFKAGKGCPLQTHVPETYYFDLRNADELDELLICDLPEINALDNKTEEENFRNGDVWILKPSVMNQGKEIHVIASTSKFREILSNPDVEDIRDWVIQRYVHKPLLLGGGRKFHIRVHVLATGALTVYVADRMLALFSLVPYQQSESSASTVHITNVCYQKGHFIPPPQDSTNIKEFKEEHAVLLLHEALEAWAREHTFITSTTDHNTPIPVDALSVPVDTLPLHLQTSRPAFKAFLKAARREADMKDSNGDPVTEERAVALLATQHIAKQINRVLAEVFGAAAGIHKVDQFIPDINTPKPDPNVLSPLRGVMSMANYTPIAGSNELYGFDFMVDERCRVWLLEANAGPDFGQTGQRLKQLVCIPMVQGVTSLLIQQHFPQLNARDQEMKVTVEADTGNGTMRDFHYCEGVDVWDLPKAPHFTPVFHAPM